MAYRYNEDDNYRERLTEARKIVSRHIEILAELAEEMKEGGFDIFINNNSYNEEDDTPGSVKIFLKKGRNSALLYKQVFGPFFLRDFGKDAYPDKESLRRAIEKVKAEIEAATGPR